MAADVGKVITVIVAYVDDSGYGQSMTSPATLPVMTEEAAAAAAFAVSLRYVANADGSVTLHWNAPDDEVTGYRILRSRHTLGEREMLVYVSDTGGTATTFTDTGVVAGVPHSYRVQAIRDGELGETTKSFKTKVFPLQEADQQPGHRRARHQRDGAGGGDTDGGHLRHRRRGRAGERDQGATCGRQSAAAARSAPSTPTSGWPTARRAVRATTMQAMTIRPIP